VAAPILHVTNGDAVVPELAAAAGVEPADVLAWRDVLHDGPVPDGLGPDALAEVRARHLTSRGWSHADDVEVSEAEALAMLRERDARLAAHPPDAEIVLWFEDDLFDALQLAQVEDRLAGRPGTVSRVHLRHPPRGDLRNALEHRERIDPEPAAFAALRSPDPRAWTTIPGFARLLEELPDARTGLTRLEREILEALAGASRARADLFHAVAAREDPPWIGDATLYALADNLDPLVTTTDGWYALTPAGDSVLAGRTTRPPIDRWLAGVQLGADRPGWAWDAAARVVVRRG
jgi:hypothetical protein